jgi:hypothetical protein
VSWDLRLAAPDPVSLSQPGFKPPWVGDPQGPLAAPGRYSVTLYLLEGGKLSPQGSPQSFEVKPLPGEGKDIDFGAIAAFQQQTSALSRTISTARKNLQEAGERLRYIEAALPRTTRVTEAHYGELERLEGRLAALQLRLTGDPVKQGMSESTVPSIASRVGGVSYGHWETRQPPTQTQKEQIERAGQDFEAFRTDLKAFLSDLDQYQADLEKAGAPWTPGQKPE